MLSRRHLLRAIATSLPALALASPRTVSRAQTAPPALLLLDPAGIDRVRARIDAGDADLAKAVKTLARDAEDALKRKPRSVVDKAQTPPSGDKRDYLSQAPYFWPDPAAPDGKPFIRRDGERNPDADAIPDAESIDAMEATVGTLALAYAFTAEPRYAESAALHLRTWFLDRRSGMRPNLNHAQLVPGLDEERASGVIEGHVLHRIPDWAALISEDAAWRSSDRDGLKRWFQNYGRWLTTSKNGKAAAKLRNNQGTWYWVQTAAAAWQAGDQSAAKRATLAGVRLITTQVRQDGAQALELERTRPLSYSLFNLRGMLALAAFGARLGIPDLCSGSAIYIRSAFDYVMRLIETSADRFEDGAEIRPREVAEIGVQAAELFGSSAYLKQASKLDASVRAARVMLTAARGKAADGARRQSARRHARPHCPGIDVVFGTLTRLPLPKARVSNWA
jgi:hypothetical protein